MQDLGDLMKQVQEIQSKMSQMQEDLANLEVTGEAGAGLIKVVMNGRHDVKRVNIDDSLLKEEKEMLEDLLAAAVNDAVRRVEESNKDKLSAMTGGFQMPPGFKMPF